MEGAYYNGQYLNRLERLGYSQAEIDNKLESTFEEMFYGPEGVRLCHCAGPDMMYIEDTGNHDVRTEGMSYAMMFCVQMIRLPVAMGRDPHVPHRRGKRRLFCLVLSY